MIRTDIERRWAVRALALLGAMLVMGCAGGRAQMPPPDSVPTAAPAVVVVPAAPGVDHQGALWTDDGAMTDLYTNVKARQVGDIVTVKIVENSSASNTADTTTGRESSITAGIDNLLGLENRYNNQTAKHPFFNPFGQIKGGLTNDFTGSGKTSRSGDLSAYVTASVVTVLPNGNLFIVGSRQVTINNERQILTLSGAIRSRDISPDNVVLSTYIADARITYSGSGVVNERQQPGWMARMLDVVWPF